MCVVWDMGGVGGGEGRQRIRRVVRGVGGRSITVVRGLGW